MPRAHEHVQAWRAAGLITAAQAERSSAHQAAAPHRSAGAARIAEVLGYVGGALALVALTVVIDQFWADLEVWGQAVLLAILAAALFAGGWWIRDRQDPPVHRLASVLWLLSVAAFAGFA